MKKMIAAIMNVALAVVGLSLYAQNVGLTGQLERDPGNQAALLDGVSIIQSGYVFEVYAPIRAFDGNVGNFVDLVARDGDVNSGTNTAYGVDFGEYGACVLTSAQILSRNHNTCWKRAQGAVICGSNDQDWFHNFDIITPPTTHTGPGQWNEVVSTSTRAYRYLFIYNPDPTALVYGPETSEIQFFGYNVVATAGMGGSVKMGDGEATQSVTAYVTSDSPVTLTAIPAEGYVFAKWAGRTESIIEGSCTNATIQVGARSELRALFSTTAKKEPGQLERDPDNQAALSPGIITIQSGYNYSGNGGPIGAFDGNLGNFVNLTFDADRKDGTRTAYGLNLGADGSCIMTAAHVLSRNHGTCWQRAKGAVICGSNSPNWFSDFEEITPPTTHTGPNQWITLDSTSSKPYRYLFIYNPDPTAVTYGPETAEIKFFGYNVFVSAGVGGSVKSGDDAAASYITSYGCRADPVAVTAIPDEGYSFLRWEGRVAAIVGGSSADASVLIGSAGELRAVFTTAERKEVGQLERVPSDQTALAYGVSIITNGFPYRANVPACAFDGNCNSFCNLAFDEELTDGTQTGYGVDFGENGSCILSYAQILGRADGLEGFTRIAGSVICGSNDPDWFHNFEIITTATAPTDMGQWNTVSSTSSKAYRYMFIYNPDPAFPAWGPQAAEIRLFGYNVQVTAEGKGKVKLGDGEAVSSITTYANADRLVTLTAIPENRYVQLDRWEGRTDAIFAGDERSPVIQVGAHAELTAVFGPVPATIIMIR
ncbi:MAG: hypothetical protein IJU44_03700 [Kiritimatiellae bacterium]|nr:hypothetical protein [Kiritimatiellia bacterium]